MNEPASKPPTGVGALCAVAFLVSFTGVALDLGLDSYGTVESNYFESTSLHLEWLRSLGESDSFDAETLRLHFDHDPFRSPHPTFSRLLSAASWQLFTRGLGVDAVVGFRLHNAFLYGLIAVGVAGFAARSFGLATGVAALLLLWGDARFFGHAHLAMPGFTLSCLWLWAPLLLLRGFETNRTAWVVATAVLSGLALATKLTGLQLVLLLAAWPLVVRGTRGIPWTLLLLAIPPVVFYVTNPQSWHEPIGWAIDFFRKFGARDEIAFIPTLFLGRVYGHEVPWIAPTVHALITTPLPILLLGLLAAARGGARLARTDRAGLVVWLRGPWPLFLAVGLSPIAVTSLPSVPAHDLERLFIHAHPILVIFAAAGFHVALGSRGVQRLAARLPGEPRRVAAALLVIVLCVPPLVQVARYHPYELIYFNALVGGPAGAETRGFDVAYSKAEANLEVLAALNELPRNTTLYANFLNWDLAAHQRAGTLRRDIRLLQQPGAAFAIIHNRRGWMTRYEERIWDGEAEPRWRLSHQGVDLVRIYDLRELTGGNR